MTNLLATLFLLSIVSLGTYASTIEKLVIDGSTGVKPLVEALASQYKAKQQATAIKIGSGLAPSERVQALLNNKIDIAMASHGIDIEQITKAGLKVHKLAKVAVVIGVNHSVNVETISYHELCGIYNGTITNWQKLNGDSMTITPLIRPFNEVDTEVVVVHVPCFSQITVTDKIAIMKKSGQMAHALSSTVGAIGMTTLVRVAQSDEKIKSLALNKVQPNIDNVLNGTYPLTRDLFLITTAKPTQAVADFLSFIYSKEGTEIVSSNHAVPFH